MFLFIFEDGNFVQKKEISIEDFASYEAGILDIINMEERTSYCGDNSWEPIEVAK